MSLAGFSLRRPYTIFAVIALMCLLAGGAALRMPTDIFPEIDIPVVSVVWTYNGMSADGDAEPHPGAARAADGLARRRHRPHRSQQLQRRRRHQGLPARRRGCQPGHLAVGQSALVVLKYMPRNITPPLILRYGATDVPIIQLSLSSNSLTDTALNDLGQNIIRPALAVVRGASVPYPYGGKPRVIMVGPRSGRPAGAGTDPRRRHRGARSIRTSSCRRAT